MNEKYIKTQSGEFKKVERRVHLKRNMNDWGFANLDIPISAQVLAMGEAYKHRFQTGTDIGPHRNQHPIQLLRYFYFLYLTGSRLMDPTAKGEEKPQIELISEKGLNYVKITKVNAKHKNPSGHGRQVIDQILPIFNSAEQTMWNEITVGGSVTNIDNIFEFDKWRSINHSNITQLIKNNFRTDLRSPERKVHRDCGITPHILRHMRCYNVLLEEGIDTNLVIKWFGWKNTNMIYYYADIRSRLETKTQIEMLKKSNKLTNLAIDMGNVISGY